MGKNSTPVMTRSEMFLQVVKETRRREKVRFLSNTVTKSGLPFENVDVPKRRM